MKQYIVNRSLTDHSSSKTAVLLVVLSFFALVPSAHAHKWASSQFYARTAGRTILFRFYTNTISIEEMLLRRYGIEDAATEIRGEELKQHKKRIVEYFRDSFIVKNNGKFCPVKEFRRIAYLEESDKNLVLEESDRILVEFTVECEQKLDELLLSSTLFEKEETEHRIIGAFVHKSAREQYFFTARSSAIIRVNELRQQRPNTSFRVRGPPGGTRIAGNLATKGKKENSNNSGEELKKAEKLGSGWQTFVVFVKQGVKHILSGIDHVLFIVALIIAVYGWKQLVKVITSFTVAHSITLVLSALSLIRISPNLVEPLIALTIVFVAVENIVREKSEARVSVTFGFGLIHGLGFGTTLQQDFGLYSQDLLAPLLGFNVGVEIGQMLVVLPLFPLILFLRKETENYGRIRFITCILVGIAAGWWFVERIVDAVSRFNPG